MLRTVAEAALEANFAGVKGMIGCDQVAELEAELKRTGRLLKGSCPLPDHKDRSPSFYCYPDGHGLCSSWWCFGCDRGGDVVDLWQAQQGPFG